MEVMPKEAKTASGIFLPENDKERPEQGTVIAVGPGKPLDNGTRQMVEVKVGDKVVFKSYSADEVKADDKTYLVVAAEDVKAVIE